NNDDSGGIGRSVSDARVAGFDELDPFEEVSRNEPQRFELLDRASLEDHRGTHRLTTGPPRSIVHEEAGPEFHDGVVGGYSGPGCTLRGNSRFFSRRGRVLATELRRPSVSNHKGVSAGAGNPDEDRGRAGCESNCQ